MQTKLRSTKHVDRRPYVGTCLVLELLWATYPGMAVAVLFFESHGLTTSEVLQVQSTVAVASSLASIPGGYLTDRIGVRNVAIGVNMLLAIQALLFWNAHGFLQYLMLAPLSGVAWCMTGTLTNSLMSRGLAEGELQQFNTWCAQARNAGIVGGLLLGGVLITQSGVGMSFAIQPFIHVASLILSFRLPRQENEPGTIILESNPQAAFMNMSLAIGRVMLQPELRWLVIFFAVLHAVTMTSFWLFQPRLKAMGVTEQLYDEVYLWRAIAAIIIVQIVHWLSKLLGEYMMVGVLLAPIVLGTLAAAFWPGWGGLIALLLGYSISSSGQSPLERTMLAKRLTRSNFRSTELAVPHALNPMTFMGASALFGLINEMTSGPVTLCCMAGIALTAGSFALAMSQKGV